MVPAGTSGTKPDGDVRDGAYSFKAKRILPVGTSSTVTESLIK